MAEYINKQDLLEKARERQNNIFGVPCIIAEIENAETVEIVRCRDCKNWDKWENECNVSTEDDSLWFENDFCSYGERRDT